MESFLEGNLEGRLMIQKGEIVDILTLWLFSLG